LTRYRLYSLTTEILNLLILSMVAYIYMRISFPRKLVNAAQTDTYLLELIMDVDY